MDVGLWLSVAGGTLDDSVADGLSALCLFPGVLQEVDDHFTLGRILAQNLDNDDLEVFGKLEFATRSEGGGLVRRRVRI